MPSGRRRPACGDQPLTGVGLRMFPSYRDSYAPLHLSSGSDVEDPVSGYHRQALLSPHNMYLLVLSEQGLIGALGLRLAPDTCRVDLAANAAGGLIARAAGCALSRRPPDQGSGRWRAQLTLLNFFFGDIGGQPTVLMSVSIGLALWWAIQPIPGRVGERSS